jgi:hypothetical protein
MVTVNCTCQSGKKYFHLRHFAIQVSSFACVLLLRYVPNAKLKEL